MSKLLLNEKPLIVLPTLATKIGLNEAIILQQIHYWLMQKRNLRDGYYWTYNSYEDWNQQFPFWSKSTIKRALSSLEKQNLIIKGNYNKMKRDRTNWYRINYQELEKYNDENALEGLYYASERAETPIGSKWTNASGQNDLTIGSKWTNASGQNEPMDEVKMTRPLPETTLRLTTENNNEDYDKEEVLSSSFAEIVNLYEELIPGSLNSFVAQKLNQDFDEYGLDLMQKAFEIAALNNKRNYNYISGILRNWKNKGIKSIEELELHEGQRKQEVEKTEEELKQEQTLNEYLDLIDKHVPVYGKEE